MVETRWRYENEDVKEADGDTDDDDNDYNDDNDDNNEDDNNDDKNVDNDDDDQEQEYAEGKNEGVMTSTTTSVPPFTIVNNDLDNSDDRLWGYFDLWRLFTCMKELERKRERERRVKRKRKRRVKRTRPCLSQNVHHVD